MAWAQKTQVHLNTKLNFFLSIPNHWWCEGQKEKQYNFCPFVPSMTPQRFSRFGDLDCTTPSRVLRGLHCLHWAQKAQRKWSEARARRVGCLSWASPMMHRSNMLWVQRCNQFYFFIFGIDMKTIWLGNVRFEMKFEWNTQEVWQALTDLKSTRPFGRVLGEVAFVRLPCALESHFAKHLLCTVNLLKIKIWIIK